MHGIRTTGILLFALLLWGASTSALGAEQLHLIVSGKTYHFEDRNFNESNWGLGLEYQFARREEWIPFITATAFLDSNKQWSKYVGGGGRYRFDLGEDGMFTWFDVGVIGFVMTRKDFRDNDPFVGILPFVSAGNDFVSINATYIPRVTPKSVPLVYVQVMFRLAEFE